MNWLLYVTLLALFSLPLWTLIHELSHFFMAKKLLKATLVSMKVFPHVDPQAGFRWGAVQFQPGVAATPGQHAAVMFAPRIADAVAAVLLPLAFLTSGSDFLFLTWTVFTAAGIVDLCNGSMGMSERSDLRRGAVDLNQPAWKFRAAGWLVAALSVGAWCLISGGHARQVLGLAQLEPEMKTGSCSAS